MCGMFWAWFTLSSASPQLSVLNFCEVEMIKFSTISSLKIYGKVYRQAWMNQKITGMQDFWALQSEMISSDFSIRHCNLYNTQWKLHGWLRWRNLWWNTPNSLSTFKWQVQLVMLFEESLGLCATCQFAAVIWDKFLKPQTIFQVNAGIFSLIWSNESYLRKIDAYEKAEFRSCQPIHQKRNRARFNWRHFEAFMKTNALPVR